MTRTGTSSGWLLEKVRKGQVWCALLSLSLGLSVASAVESSWSADRAQPAQLEDRAIDPTLAEIPTMAVDPPPSGLFYLTLGSSFLVFFLLLSLLNGWVVRGLLGEAMEKEKSGILLLSQFSLALYALHLVVGDAVPESLRMLLHLLCGLLILSMVAKYLVAVNMRSDRKWALIWNLLNDDQLMLAALFMPAVVISLGGWVRGSLDPTLGLSGPLALVLYLVVLLVLLGGYLLIARRVVATARGGMGLALYDLNTAAIVSGAPLLLIPLGLQVASEIQFSVPAATPKAIGTVVVAILIATSATIFVLQRRGLLKLGGVAILAGFYFPAMVMTLASFKTHRWTLNLGSLDYYTSGQKVLPAQQWSDFGSLPLLDLVPSHGLADVGIQSLFTWFNGVDGLDMLVWLPWIPVVIGFLIIYTFLAIVTSPLLALLITILLPIKATVVGQYAVVLLPAVFLVIALRRPDFRRFLVLWMATGLLLLWRPQLGWPAALAVLILVGLVALVENREILVPAITSFVIVLGLVPAGVLIAEIVWGGDTYIAVADFVGLLGSAGVRGFGAIETSPGMVGITSFLHRVLPVLAVICVLYFGLRQFVRQQAFTIPGYAVFYLVVFSLMVPARSITHDGGQLFDPSLLLLTLALMPFLVAQRTFQPRQIGRSTWLMATLVSCAFLGSIDFYHLVGGGGPTADLRAWKPGESRVLFNRGPHQDVVEFLQRELADDESFLDFTGSTALYALAAKRFPFRTISDFRTTSESLQRSQIAVLQDHRQAGNLPLVVFRSPPRLKQSPPVPPTEAISYRIAEFVYANYLPYARVAGWEVWRERGVKRGKPKPPAKTISSKSIQQKFLLGNLPHRWASDDPWEAISKTDVLAAVLEQPLVVRAEAPLRLPWTPGATSPMATYLHVRAWPLSGRESALTISYGPEPQSSFEIRLAPRATQSLGDEETIELELREDPKKHMMHRVARFSERSVFQSTGKDPWLHKFVDLSRVPTIEAKTEQWIRIRYRATKNGQAQIFLAGPGKSFKERNSLKMPLLATRLDGAARQLMVPVVGVEIGSRLANLRFDPPPDVEFELVGLELLLRPSQPDDYLIRLTTQFQWATSGSHPLTLSSNSQVLIDSMYLRAGD